MAIPIASAALLKSAMQQQQIDWESTLYYNIRGRKVASRK
jgi:hypothetical protein